MSKIKIFDSTLRDGLHAVEQSVDRKDIEDYCSMIDDTDVYTTIVAHGNGLGASSIHMGECSVPELEMLSCARKNVKKVKLGTFLTVGFGTLEKHIIPAIEIGAEVFCIATHCTEANVLRKHIEYLSRNNKEVYGVLMNIHMASKEVILEQALLIQSYGANGVILMDSAGSSVPSYVGELVAFLADGLEIEIGFHAHNNLGLAVANALEAVKNGATIVDGTVGGFGAGAGNCAIELILPVLIKENVIEQKDFFGVLDISKHFIAERLGYTKNVEDLCVVSGYAGVVSTLKQRVLLISKEFQVDPRKVFIELGKKSAITGQDDLIMEVAQNIKNGGLKE